MEVIEENNTPDGQVGFTNFGFSPKRLPEILADLQAKYRQYLGDDIRIDEASVLGNIIAPESIEIAGLWELAEQATHTLDARYATGIALDNLAVLAGVKRQPAKKSSAILLATGTAGTIIPKGTTFRDSTAQSWVSIQTVDIPTTTTNISVESVEFGSISASANTINQIIDPVAGLANVTNPAQAIEGRLRETDADLRARIYDNSTSNGVGSIDGLSNALNNIEGVSYARIVENDTMTDSIPPNIVTAKSFMVVIAGGTTEDIGNAIWRNKPAGIATNGTTGVDIKDINGDTHNINFQRPDNVDIWLDIEISATEQVPSITPAQEEAIKVSIVEWSNENLSVGDDVINSRLYIPINDALICTVNHLYQAKTANPTTSTDIAIEYVERSIFDVTRITITVV